jgi:hypothetical protein
VIGENLEDKTIVVIRRLRGKKRAIIALFPEVPGDSYGRLCLSYLDGEYGTFDIDTITLATQGAERLSIESMVRDLINMGYTIETRKSVLPGMNNKRLDKARKTMADSHLNVENRIEHDGTAGCQCECCLKEYEDSGPSRCSLCGAKPTAHIRERSGKKYYYWGCPECNNVPLCSSETPATAWTGWEKHNAFLAKK